MNTTPRKFYAAEDGNNPYPGCKILTAENPNGQNSTSSGQPDKKLTPMAAHIEWLKKERKTLYEFGYDVAADRISKAIHNATSLLEAEREYASQQAPAMYTREQVEAAFTAGMNYEYGNHFGAVPNSYMNKQQFIQSIK